MTIILISEEASPGFSSLTSVKIHLHDESVVARLLDHQSESLDDLDLPELSSELLNDTILHLFTSTQHHVELEALQVSEHQPLAPETLRLFLLPSIFGVLEKDVVDLMLKEDKEVVLIVRLGSH